VHYLDPFGKIGKRIVNGDEDNLASYFSDMVPAALRSAQ
jgi:hypothetical protein